MRTPLGKDAQAGWISRQLNFQLVQPRLRGVNSRPHMEGKRLRCLGLLHADGSPWTETGGFCNSWIPYPLDRSSDMLLTGNLYIIAWSRSWHLSLNIFPALPTIQRETEKLACCWPALAPFHGILLIVINYLAYSGTLDYCLLALRSVYVAFSQS